MVGKRHFSDGVLSRKTCTPPNVSKKYKRLPSVSMKMLFHREEPSPETK